MLKRIGAEEGGEFKAIASGTLPSGKPVVVNADGTVSTVSQTAASLGTEGAFNSLTSSTLTTVFDSSNNKHIIVYRTSSNMRYVVATVASDGGVSFGTDAVVLSGGHQGIASAFDSTNNRIVTVFRNANDSSHGYAMVGSLSGTTVTWGSATEFNNANSAQLGISFDSTAGKVVISYRDYGNSQYGTAIVGTVSGTSISFGTPVVFNSGTTGNSRSVHDSTNNKTVLFWADGDDGAGKGDAVVGTISGTSISFGSTTRFEAGAISHSGIAYDSDTGKVVIAYRQNHETDGATDFKRGTAVVGTVSGTSISFGTAVAFDNTGDYGENTANSVIYDSNAKKVLVVYPRTVSGSYSNRGYVFPLKVSGTTVVADTPTDFAGATAVYPAISFDSNVNKNLIAFGDGGNNEYATAVSFAPLSGNLTSENYIGMSRGVAFQTGSDTTSGTAVQFESGNMQKPRSAYDTTNNRVVIAYADLGNSYYGTAVVGTVSGTSISFGTPVVFNSAQSNGSMSIVFDDNAGKVVISYQDGGTNTGESVVGTVSGTSISFGSTATFIGNDFSQLVAAYDSNSNKVFLVCRDQTISNKNVGTVGTVSGTSISFGSNLKISDHIPSRTNVVFDSNANKFLIIYYDSGDSNKGKSVVATIADSSATTATYGSEVIFHNASTDYMAASFDSDANKILVVYEDSGDSNKGKAVVGTISGTSVSYGSEVEIGNSSATLAEIGAVYDTNLNAHIITYRPDSATRTLETIAAQVSGTTATFSSPVSLTNSVSDEIAYPTFDPDTNKVIVAYRDDEDSGKGKAVVLTPALGINTTRGEVADGGNASMDIIGSVSDNQIGLTAGQQYFVQTDGTISTTAGSPSVLAGTAISATELVVKT